jgi:hypothetical protein
MSGFLPKHNRRLTDILLAGFNHAYAVGERDIAEQLRGLLQELEGRRYNGGSDRRRSDAINQAELWVAFVEARDRYRELCDKKPDHTKTLSALEAMKESYRLWSLS